MSVTHSKVSAIADGGDTSLVQPSDWNAVHVGYPDILFADAPNQNFDLTNGGAGGAVTIISESVTGIAAGDFVDLEIFFSILNNSGSSRTYAPILTLGTLVITATDLAAVGASATSRSIRKSTARFSVSATDLAFGQWFQHSTAAAAVDTDVALTTNLNAAAWDTTTDDITGTQTLSLTVSSNSTTATQTLTLHSYVIRKISSV